ncbi:MAG TPA: cupredoxin domain-containing protein [Candidatus Limnocylindrales bacterium]
MTRRLRLGALIATAALTLAACSGGGATVAPASPAPAASAPASVAASACSVGEGTGAAAEIKDFAFPTGLSVAAGQAIAWTNGDSANHTVTFDDGSCNTAVGSGATVVVTYTVPGTYPFHCAIHTSMTGSLEVK